MVGDHLTKVEISNNSEVLRELTEIKIDLLLIFPSAGVVGCLYNNFTI